MARDFTFGIAVVVVQHRALQRIRTVHALEGRQCLGIPVDGLNGLRAGARKIAQRIQHRGLVASTWIRRGQFKRQCLAIGRIGTFQVATDATRLPHADQGARQRTRIRRRLLAQDGQRRIQRSQGAAVVRRDALCQ